MTDRPADARAFSRPAPKAREKRPGDEVVNQGYIHNLHATVKNWIERVKTTPGNLFLTVKIIIHIQNFGGNYGNKP